jgi:glycosyltransferase involved in cell wall biosynthesis
MQRRSVFHVIDEASEQALKLFMPDKLTVIMPAFNAADTVEVSIRSVQNQTYSDWVMLVIDDGSTDNTLSICERLSFEDPRIIPVSVSHRGLVGVLNLGLRVSKSRLIARADADDIHYPERFSKQLQFLAENPSVKVLGTWGDLVNERGDSLQKVHTGPGSLAALAVQRKEREFISLLHTSVMAYRDVLLENGGYDTRDYPAEDAWLWARISQSYDVMALPEYLVGFSIRATGISATNFRAQLTQFRRIEHWLKGGDLLNPESFDRMERTSWLRRISIHHDYLYRRYFRLGASYFVNSHPVRGLSYLACCAVLRPIVFGRRIWKRLTVPGDVSRYAPENAGV